MRPQYHFRNSERGLLAWDVRKLVAMSQDLPVENVLLTEIAELDESFWYALEGDAPPCRSIAMHSRLIAETDLAYPIILDPDGRVMDGSWTGHGRDAPGVQGTGTRDGMHPGPPPAHAPRA